VTSRRVARLLAFALALAVIAALMVDGARTENYGTATAREQAQVKHAIHAWFDKHRLGATMVCVADRESGFTAAAYNDDDSPTQMVAGVFQIAWPLWTPTNPAVRRQPRRYGWVLEFWHRHQPTWLEFRHRLADPVQSIRLAYMLVRHHGLDPWNDGCR
jgi:hypothetical protein